MTDLVDWSSDLSSPNNWPNQFHGGGNWQCSPVIGPVPEYTNSLVPNYTYTAPAYSTIPQQRPIVHNSAPNQTIFPTPPRSPQMEYELAELVASIPEILDSSCFQSEVKNFKEILDELESTSLEAAVDHTPAVSFPYDLGNSGQTTRPPLTENLLKKDIMWSGAACSTSPTAGPSTSSSVSDRRRLYSESSDDAQIPDPLKSYLSEDEEEPLLHTPPRCDSDEEEVNTAFVKMEHNYCGANTPPYEASLVSTKSELTESEEKLDFISFPGGSSAASGSRHVHEARLSPAGTSTALLQAPSKTRSPSSMTSAQVKKQLQISIHESMNKKRRPTPTVSPSCPLITPSDVPPHPLGALSTANGSCSPCPSSSFSLPHSQPPLQQHGRSSLISPGGATSLTPGSSNSRSTQGKPAAYTKRMREYHSEVLRSNKRKRPRSGETDEGRRFNHNSLERQRRVDLKESFDALRLLVPETAKVDKAPKVQILKKAAQYCLQLQMQEAAFEREKEELVRELEALRRQKTQLS